MAFVQKIAPILDGEFIGSSSSHFDWSYIFKVASARVRVEDISKWCSQMKRTATYLIIACSMKEGARKKEEKRNSFRSDEKSAPTPPCSRLVPRKFFAPTPLPVGTMMARPPLRFRAAQTKPEPSKSARKQESKEEEDRLATSKSLTFLATSEGATRG